MKRLTPVIILFFVLISISNAYSQNDGIVPKPITATIIAKGTVLSPISVSDTKDLDFGEDILPGIDRVIDKNSNSAGKFTIMGQPGKEISITMSLGGNIVDFDPFNPVNAVFGNDGTMEIYLGGTAKPYYSQAAGMYDGTVTVVFYYTGN
ncbi:MAG: hypothetical protein MUE56_08060 [Ignavibacteria bacterium]|nr:hypothetical protein [Ignavibacteria bacterium]